VQNPDDSTAKALNSWGVQEFFRIELLLRSSTVQTMYRIGGAGPETTIVLGLTYGFTWDVLQGSHHRYLRGSSELTETIPGLSVMTLQQFVSKLETLNEFLPKLPEAFRTQLVKNLHARFLGLLIDPAIPPKSVLKAIEPPVEARHIPSHPSRMEKLYAFHVSAWLGYLRCYDLRVSQRWTFGQISKHVYERAGEKTRDRAEKAVRRTSRFIQLAESMNWPPPRSSTSKS
jgi:hypothetical protein